MFLTFIAAKFGQSAKSSLLAGEIAVTEVDKDIIPNFNAKAEEKSHLDGLKN